ncbi:hypothetical protein [Aeromonas caviae]|uniref:hypothetical protein n=1 Tax=Aeromonas caviae TaxID=648 RepID=UPI0018D98D6B|nr:hypothetical protein [Aeromonas caviae]
MNLNESLSTDLLKEGKNKEQFVGRPFYLSYDIARLLVCDAWKAQVKGIPAGCFLLAFYDGEDGVEEAVLLRALSQTKLPTDNVSIHRNSIDTGKMRRSSLDPTFLLA